MFDERVTQESFHISRLFKTPMQRLSMNRNNMIVQLRVSLFPLLFCMFTLTSSIYLSNTNDHRDVQFYDFVRLHSSSLDYCRRPKEPTHLERDNHARECQDNAGQLHQFSELRSKNISMTTILHRWKSSVERVEDYQRYLRDSSSQSDGSLCECLHRGSFGKNCEYQLPVGQTFEETVQWQLVMRKQYLHKVNIYGDVVCYETLQCDSGVLCLDWREICDGFQNCLLGQDEENCDLLEMNRCDPEEEYRCTNGMCISQEFFLDGELDCLDWSDEMQLKADSKCPGESVSAECDDHLCPLNVWSCGDGQCIEDRLKFQSHVSPICTSGRDQYYHCETRINERQWTMSNGRCINFDLHGDSYDARVTNGSRDDECSYLVQCSLSRVGENYCPCGGNRTCADRIRNVCSFPSSLTRYPRGSIGAPFMFFLHNLTRHWNKRLADFMLINGSVRCRDSSIVVKEKIIPLKGYIIARRPIEDQLCRTSESDSSPRRERCYRGNESMFRCPGLNPCLSSTRIQDGSLDCANGTDEDVQAELEVNESCASVQRHRFRCSREQATCFPVMRLGDSSYNCPNGFDERWFGSDRDLSSINCHQRRQDECSLLRQYIQQSSSSRSIHITVEPRIRFRSHCDSFWDVQSKEDEDLLLCKQFWICPEDQHRCSTGQCIEKNWLNDLQWDCANAEDEHHRLNSITFLRLEEASTHDFTNRSYFIPRSCPQPRPFLCLSANATREGFSCFNLSQLGDGRIDCAGGIDERMTLPHCSHSSPSMLGENFRCPSTNSCVPFHLHCLKDHRCPNRSDDNYWCDRQNRSSNSSFVENAFICFNGRQIRSRRCDDGHDCLFGEDEYACDYSRSFPSIRSRQQKLFLLKVKTQIVRLKSFPRDSNVTPFNANPLSTSTLPPTTNLSLNHPSLSPYWCNRGLGILSTTTKDNSTVVCFCPPHYYGHKCQFHADRVSVVLQLNFTRSISSRELDSQILLKLIVLFLFNDEIVMRDHFHLHSSSESTRSKLRTNFVFPHSSSSREERRQRFFNRSSLLLSHPYSIQISLYQTRRDEQASLIATWKYPLFFSHLPVTRFAKVLHLTSFHPHFDPCSSRPCHWNQRCQALINNPSQFICLCRTNFNGENCSQRDPQCHRGYCAEGSLCQPNRVSSMRDDSSPFCLCPLNRVGHRCEIEHDGCLSSPCLHGRSCFPDSRPSRVICVCTREYFGSECQSRRPSIVLSVSLISPEHRGAVIQYWRIDFVSLDVHLADQQVFKKLPQQLEYFHSDPQTTLPEIVLAKIYSSDKDSISADLFLLSVHLNISFLTGTTQISEINRCDHQRTLSNNSSPIQYHHICIRDPNRLCFRDDFYLCICGNRSTHIECFLYDDQLDRCELCRSHGRCLQGNRRRSQDFVCLCPACHSGDRCQFNTESFSFTLDQLFSPDLHSDQRQTTISLLIVFSLLLFFLALPNNIFSLITLRRRSCLRYGIGHYLLAMSVVNQLNLLLFVARLIHLIFKITDDSPSSWSLFDDLMCKLLNYFLSSLTRLVYWLTSLISIERVYMTIFINGQWLRKPRIARRLILLILFVVLLTDLYELFFYRSLSNVATGQGSICVLEISKNDRTLWMTFHLLFLILNSLLPFSINLLSTIIIIAIIVKKKMKIFHTNTSEQLDGSHRVNIQFRLRLILDVLRENQEFVIGPAITLVPQLFSLPLFISSFIFNCQNLEESWLRHFLIVSYWISFTPQWTSFFLYISPSSFYSNEWRQTNVGRWMTNLPHRLSGAQTTTFPALSGKRNIVKDKD